MKEDTDAIQERENQFFPDAFQLVSQLRTTAESDRVAVAAAFLRKFAEYVTTGTLSAPAGQDVQTLVDNMPAMGEGQ